MRTWKLLIVMSAMLAFVAACSSDDDDADDVTTEEDTATEVQPTDEPEPEPTEPPEPTATPEPEPTEPPAPTPEPEPEPTEAPDVDETDDEGTGGQANGIATPSEGELSAYLLSLDDLPAGWTQDESDTGDAEDFGDVSDEPFENPCGIEPPEFEPVAEGDRSFQGTELGPFLFQTLAQFNSSDGSAEAVSLMREVFACEEWTETDEFGEEMTFTVEEIPFEGIGDEAFMISIGLDFGDESPEMQMFGDISFDMVVFQRNEFVSMMMYFDIFGAAETDVESIFRAADEKLQ